jgi:malonyl CoA-acyl carrier protein transacylase/NAD(P)-dependent dehydrogenase (short-subunit alcohol dehydrogenase family)/acyl-CoA thioesterase FadM/3-hydroxymyristoyl/3-hydroxydecanoyl-(acyl carrier protein) dehydratase/acyl carrier protein
VFGGGYTVDGACSSSLLAVATAATQLANGNLDLVLAGGVDISLDTFEMIGFSKTRALAKNDMNVYDRGGSGFIPGEGCGFVALKRLEDARKDKNYIYAVVHGWGISSDGKSTGITAPSAQGQSRALKRAYAQAPYNMDSLKFLEGHGTGTTVGDRVELEGIAMAMGDFAGKVENSLRHCAITSLKSIIGHCKAAAGIGGFIKSVMAVNQRIVPPTAACQDPHPVFNTTAKRLYPAKSGEILDPEATIRAGVSAMGFGGINCHVTLESGDPPSSKLKPSMDEKNLLVSNQHTELFLITADSAKGMRRKIENLLEISKGISIAELTDLAAKIPKEIEKKKIVRCAVIAGNPDELKSNLEEALAILQEKFPNESSFVHNPLQKVWIGNNMKDSRVGILFPGQGSQQLNMGRVLAERFTWAGDLLRQADKAAEKYGKGAVGKIISRPYDRAVNQELINNWQKTLSMTKYAQPAICLTSLIWFRFLENLGLKPAAVGGHSLGELTAFHAAGAISQQELFHLAALRGKAMAESGSENGKMITLRCSKSEAEEILRKINGYLVIANINGPQQIVLSGKTEAVKEASQIAAKRGIQPKEIPVSNAFHSKLASHAAQVIRNEPFLNKKSGKISTRIFSSFMGKEVPDRIFLNHHFSDQILAPVNFMSMIQNMAKYCDLFIEAGPGRVLTGLTNSITADPGPFCYPIESAAFQDEDLNRAMAALFIHGVNLRWEKLYSGRLVRHFTPVSEKIFIENPCERPFDIAKVSGIPVSLERSTKLTVEGLLSELINFSESELSSYLKTRGHFLAKVIEADLKYPAIESPFLGTATKESKVLIKETITDLSIPESPLKSIEAVVLSNVEKITGFSTEILNLEMRLLDDLNLDSIKATDLVVKISRDLTADFSLETLDFAKASLRDIIENLYETLDTSQPVTSKPHISDAFEIVMARASQLTGYPIETLDADALVTKDLNIGPEQLQKIIESSSRSLKVDPYLDLEPLKERSLRQIASILSRIKKEQTQSGSPHASEELSRIQMYHLETWVRDFQLEMVETDFSNSPETGRKRREDNWQHANVLILYDPDSSDASESIHRAMIKRGAQVRTESFEEALSRKLNQDDYPGPEFSMLVAILPQTPDQWQSPEIYLQQMIRQVSVIASPPSASQAPRRRTSVVYVQFGGGSFGAKQPFYHPNLCCASALAKSIHLERDDLRVRVLDFFRGIDPEKLAEKAITEIHTPDAFAAVGFDHELRRYLEKPKLLDPAIYHDRNINWSSEDVILVTGGAKGITASIALGVAKETGARMALVGSSPDPDKHPEINSSREISATLLKFSNNGLVAKYFSCDVSNKVSVEKLVEKISKEWGKVTGVIHGAGINKPRATKRVSVEDAFEEVGPKVLGVLNLISTFEKSPPKIFAGISSIIGYTGMPRNAWYAFSNEVLDILLRKFGYEHPQTAVFSVAYSIWRDEGMGHRMGGVDYLKRRGIDAIATDEGVKRFVTLFKKNPGTDRIIVAARLGGIDTFSPVFLPGPVNVRYLEKAIYIIPAIESIFQVHLSLENDPYLKDHSFKGSFLFPTVFGLEAMAQTAAHALGKTTLERVRIENILLKQPITVDPGTGADILIQAQVQEKPDSSSARKINTKIFKLDTGIREAYFSAEFILDLEDAPGKKNIPKARQPLGIIPKYDLYRDNLLFQGPLFQRIHKIFSIVPKANENSEEAEEAIFTTWVFDPETTSKLAFKDSANSNLLLGDPFFRDSLLQSAQMLIPTVTCLPVFIQKLDIYPSDNVAKKTLTGIVSLDQRKKQEIQHSVVVADDKGFVRETLEGYNLRVLKRYENNPFPADLINPEKRDLLELQTTVNSAKDAFGIEVPSFHLEYMAGIHKLSKDQRYACEIPLINKTLEKALGNSFKESDLDIRFLDNGEPVLKNSTVDISISHDDRLFLCVSGKGPQGCNFEPIISKSRQQWIDLIGRENKVLLDELLDKSDTVDHAGTRISCAKKAINKATGNIFSNMEIYKTEKDMILFRAEILDQSLFVLTFPIILIWGPERMFSLVVGEILKDDSSKEKIPSVYAELDSMKAYENYEGGGPQGQDVFIHRFPTAFKPNAQLSRKVYFTNYVYWLGGVREIGVWSALKDLLKHCATREYGIVTNRTNLKILGEVTLGDRVEILAWITKNYGKKDSTMDLTYDIRKILHNQKYERLAWCEQQLTWVKIVGHGIVEPDAYPDFYCNCIKDMLPKYDAPNVLDTMQEPMAHLFNVNGDYEQYVAPTKPVIEPFLFEKAIDTTFDNSNVLGNIYFANYFTWQGQLRDHYFYGIIPEYFRGVGEKGELLCLQSQIQHMREAMPFDTVIVTMSLKLLKKYSAIFYFEYFKLENDGNRTKLAFGEQQNIWVVRDKQGNPIPSAFPQPVLEKFKKAIFSAKHPG